MVVENCEELGDEVQAGFIEGAWGSMQDYPNRQVGGNRRDWAG